MLPAAHLSHATTGRARVRIASKRGQAGYFSQVEQRLARLPGVRDVTVNPRTGSVLVKHTTSVDELIAFAEREDLFRLPLPGLEGPPLPQAFTDRIKALDRHLNTLSGGALDLRTASALTLLGIGVVQFLRGQIAGPATTMFWYATTLLLLSPPGAGTDDTAEA